ncbi:hypothetical protein D9M68_718960 [compost metagenome]
MCGHALGAEELAHVVEHRFIDAKTPGGRFHPPSQAHLFLQGLFLLFAQAGAGGFTVDHVHHADEAGAVVRPREQGERSGIGSALLRFGRLNHRRQVGGVDAVASTAVHAVPHLHRLVHIELERLQHG